jgi:hypothetical protein
MARPGGREDRLCASPWPQNIPYIHVHAAALCREEGAVQAHGPGCLHSISIVLIDLRSTSHYCVLMDVGM